MEDNDKKPFDKFELVTALLLGLTAIGAAIAGQQAGQWGGKQLEAFSSANTLTTKAATQYTEDTVLINADYAAVAAAKSFILNARDAGGQDRERNLDLASYQYMYQMSELGYKSMGLPMEYYVEDEEEGEGEETGATVATAENAGAQPEAVEAVDAEEAGEEEDPEEVAATAMERDIPDEVLLASLGTELDEDYIDQALAEGTKMFEEADKKFEEGRVANENGDKFDLVTVWFTVALFFAGLGLVFKTTMRWGFFGAGLVLFAVTAIYMMTLPWA
ncbi:MAG TPA: hypothetical protein VJ725_27040 [Thermoanaerobaculia bacterium]|nr:hypothetical protein [Thermoanaerobaculia bacterium]